MRARASLALASSSRSSSRRGTSLERSYRLYFGPKIEEAVVAVDPKLATSIDAGWAWVRPLVVAFGGLLRWTHDHVVPNYGVAIILLDDPGPRADLPADAALRWRR